MDHFIIWLNSLPFLLHWLVIASIVGSGTAFMMSGQHVNVSAANLKGFKKFFQSLVIYLIIYPVCLVVLGLVVMLSFATILGPYFMLLSVFQWPYILALLVGLPTGLLLIIGDYALADSLFTGKFRSKQ